MCTYQSKSCSFINYKNFASTRPCFYPPHCSTFERVFELFVSYGNIYFYLKNRFTLVHVLLHSGLNLYYVQAGIFMKSIFVYLCKIFLVFRHIIYAIFFWQLVNKTANCFNNIVFILVEKISSKKICKKMKNISTLEKVSLVCNRNAELLRLVGATIDSNVVFLRRMRKENLIILKCLQKNVWHFLFYSYVVVDIWVVKYQLKVFGKL